MHTDGISSIFWLSWAFFLPLLSLLKSFVLLGHNGVNNVNKLAQKTQTQSGVQIWVCFSLYRVFKCELAAKFKTRRFHIKTRTFTLSWKIRNTLQQCTPNPSWLQLARAEAWASLWKGRLYFIRHQLLCCLLLVSLHSLTLSAWSWFSQTNTL